MFSASARRNFIIVLLLVIVIAGAAGGRRKYSLRRRQELKTLKQLAYEARETSTPNFVRLVLMRLVYGIAVQMGVDDRLDNVFGGAFVPPNAVEESEELFDVFSDEGDDEYGL